MKNIIKIMVNEYGKERIYYSFIVFGNEFLVELRFFRIFDSDVEFKVYFDFQVRVLDGVVLDKVLKKVVDLFGEYYWEGVKNVLVVIMDKRFISNRKDVQSMVVLLWEDDVEVILIVFGSQVDKKELELIMFYKENLILVYVNNKMVNIVQRIMDKMMKGKVVKLRWFNCYFRKM